MTPPRTVKVRIACAVDRTGRWSACGWSDEYGGYDPTSIQSVGKRHMLSRERWYFIMAEVPVPVDEDVAGAVESDLWQTSDWRSMRLDDMPLSTRAQHFARHYEGITLGELDSMDDHQLRGHPNIGRDTINEIKRLLAWVKVHLSSSQDGKGSDNA